MYGMVNKAIEDMVVSAHGEEMWSRIRDRAGVEEEVFVTTEGYPDHVTYSLVAAASEVLQTPAAEILEAFGVFWVVKTAQEGYGDMMAAGGKSVGEFMKNLPNFHSRVSIIFPHLAPPKFLCSDIDARSIRMHYQSHRAGLAPFVVGLFKGIGQMFNTPVTVEQVADKSAGANHDEFVVRW